MRHARSLLLAWLFLATSFVGLATAGGAEMCAGTAYSADRPIVRPAAGVRFGYGWPTKSAAISHPSGNYYGLGAGASGGVTIGVSRCPRSPGLWLGVDFDLHLGTDASGQSDSGVAYRRALGARSFALGLGLEAFLGPLLVRPSLFVGSQYQWDRCLQGNCQSESGTLTYAALAALVAYEIADPLGGLRALRVGLDLRSATSTSVMWGFGAPNLDATHFAVYAAAEVAL